MRKIPYVFILKTKQKLLRQTDTYFRLSGFTSVYSSKMNILLALPHTYWLRCQKYYLFYNHKRSLIRLGNQRRADVTLEKNILMAIRQSAKSVTVHTLTYIPFARPQ